MNRREQEIWREALRATSLGWDLALPIFGGVLIGYLLDRTLDTTYVFTLGFLVFGIATGFYNVFRSIRRLDECSREERAKEEEQENETDQGAR
ncbi:MAG: AtpZ/AtpI family protein [Anaerolineae bacterium]